MLKQGYPTFLLENSKWHHYIRSSKCLTSFVMYRNVIVDYPSKKKCSTLTSQISRRKHPFNTSGIFRDRSPDTDLLAFDVFPLPLWHWEWPAPGLPQHGDQLRLCVVARRRCPPWPSHQARWARVHVDVTDVMAVNRREWSKESMAEQDTTTWLVGDG